MDAAALLVLISGVAFGWQPMPDGSQQYEYIVQVDPELARTLADGQSIPIAGDVPEYVHPIGRIRLVVGREQPPRQRLVTRMKPPTGDGSGVQLAQYTQPQYTDQRYGAAPQQSAPVSSAPPAATRDPYAQPQAAAAGQQSDSPGASWNSGQDEQPITPTAGAAPSGQDLFGRIGQAGATWNGQAESAAAEVAAAPDRLRQGLENAVAPVQRGIERLDGEVRSAAGNLGDRTKNLVDELRQPFQQPQLPADSRQAAPNASSPSEQSWNNAPATQTNPLRGNTPQTTPQQGATWNGQAATQGTPPMQAPPFTSAQTAPQTPAGSTTDWNNGSTAAPNTAATGAGSGQQPGANGDPWAGVPDPRPQSSAGTGASSVPLNVPGVATRPMPFGGVGLGSTGPQFPDLGTPVGQQAGTGAASQPGATAPPTSEKTPTTEVRGNMLAQPADRPLDGVSPGASPAAVPYTTTGPFAATTTQPHMPSTMTGSTTQPGQTMPSATQVATQAIPAAPIARDNTIAVLVAWVLLSGSIAGNLYLFWSYLDVRHKYRGARKTARAVGSRFSAA